MSEQRISHEQVINMVDHPEISRHDLANLLLAADDALHDLKYDHHEIRDCTCGTCRAAEAAMLPRARAAMLPSEVKDAN